MHRIAARCCLCLHPEAPTAGWTACKSRRGLLAETIQTRRFMDFCFGSFEVRSGHPPLSEAGCSALANLLLSDHAAAWPVA